MFFAVGNRGGSKIEFLGGLNIDGVISGCGQPGSQSFIWEVKILMIRPLK